MKKTIIDKNILVEMYKTKSAYAIAKHFGCDTNTIISRLKEYNIPTRDYSASQKNRFKQNPESHGWKGKKHSDEQRREWSIERFGKYRGKENPAYKNGQWAGRWYRRFRGSKCEICGSTIDLCMHHKDGDHFNNSPENWITVCRNCHIKIHTEMGSYSRKK